MPATWGLGNLNRDWKTIAYVIDSRTTRILARRRGFRHRIVRSCRLKSKSHGLYAQFLFVAPIVVFVTFKTPRFNALRSRMVALPAGANSGQKNIGCFLTRARFGMAGFAGHEAMLFVIEDCMLEPAHGNIGFHHHRWLSGRTCGERMALLTGFRPEELLGLRNPRVHPLLRRVDAR